MCGWRRTHHQDITCRSLSLLLCYLLAIKQDVSAASDTLSSTESLSETLTLVSKGNTFELGFFNTSSLKAYLGIWYKGFPNRTVVWVANRDSPLPSEPTSHLKFSSDGNLGLFDNESNMVWSTGLISPLPSETIEAVILDDGNFVLRDSSKPNVFFWQSFDHPTDTWLPGSRIGFDRVTGETKRLVAWKTENDPSSGMYSLGISRNSNFELFLEWNMSGNSYWNSGFWNGIVFGLIPEISYLSKFDFSTNENDTSYTYSLFNEGVFSRIIVSSSGQLEQLTSLRGHRNWSVTTSRPMCGTFGMLNNDLKSCSCLIGFVPISEQVDGCSRRTLLKCENSTAGKETKDDGFRELSGMKFPASPKLFPTRDVRSCRSACLNNCSCTAYALDDQGGCLIWDGPLVNSQQLLKDDKNGRSLYVKVSYSELIDDTGKIKKIIEILIGVLVPLAFVLSGGFMGFLYKRRIKKKENVHSGEDLLSFDFNCSNGDSRTNREHHLDLPVFNYESVLAATDGFSAQNKLGEGGFGPVYKGNLLNGQEIAIKRLSKRSGQGSEEFRNEILLIAKLQHRNLVRLLGCCNEQDESILIYEYMPNKSLDHFIFDPQKQEILDWRTRIRIINGIAQGLLYLHEHSRLRIIHRDLKLSNVLLDSGMNPKISDFGLARMFDGGDDSSQINTKHIVGTHGYMAPEYVMVGLISTKSDVFSFGVLVLEIISGKRNTGFYDSDDHLNLLEHAWELWNSKRVTELLDRTVDVESPAVLTAVLRYINVGLLCVQANPDDRLGMSSVVSMLGSEGSDLLREPKQPAFIARSVVAFNVGHSINGLTFSTLGQGDDDKCYFNS